MRAPVTLLITPFVIMAVIGLSACTTSARDAPDPVLTPYKIAAGDDALALRATPSSSVVAEIYSWVNSSNAAQIETRLRAEIPNTTARLYNRQDGVRVKYTGPARAAATKGGGDVYYWSRATGQIRRGTWDIKDGKFGPQICETFYGEEACLNTVEQLSGVGVIDRRAGDVFGLANGMRPEIGEDGLPEW